MSEPKENKPKTNMPRFNLSWLYIIIAMTFAYLWFAEDGSSSNKQLTYTEFKSLVNKGYANNVEMANKELQTAKKNQQKALKEQEEAQKAQEIIKSAQQVANLITATSLIFVLVLR